MNDLSLIFVCLIVNCSTFTFITGIYIVIVYKQ